MRTPVRMDVPHRIQVLVRDHDTQVAIESEFRVSPFTRKGLNNLKWEWHVHDPRHAKQETFWHGVVREPLIEVCSPFFQGRLLIRKRTALHDTISGRNADPRGMVFDVEGRCGIERLPETRDVGMTVRRAWWNIRSGPRRRVLTCYEPERQQWNRKDNQQTAEPFFHATCSQRRTKEALMVDTTLSPPP